MAKMKYSKYSLTIFRKIIFHEINPESFSQCFLLIFQFSENLPKIIAHEFCEKHFPLYNFPKFSEDIETILVNVRFQFCLAVESTGQDE